MAENTDQQWQKWAWLCPFNQRFYYGHEHLTDYFQLVPGWLPFAPDDEDAFQELISEGLSNGWLRQIPGDYAILQIQPLWRNQLLLWTQRNMPARFQQEIQEGFCNYYNQLAKELRTYQISNDPGDQSLAATLIGAEMSNLQSVMRTLAQQKSDYAFISTVLRNYFQQQDSSARWLEQALFLLDAGNKEAAKERIARLDDVAVTLLELKQPAEALPYVKEAWDLSAALPENDAESALIRSTLCNNFSRCATTFEEQRLWLTRAWIMAKEAGLSNLAARMAYNLSELLLEHHLYAESRVLLDEATAVFRESGAASLLLQTLLSQASRARMQGQPDEAIRFLNEALDMHTNPLKEAEIRQDLASVLFECGKPDDAEKQSKLAIQVFLSAGNRQMEGTSLNLLSAIAFMQGDGPAGLEYAQRALECFSETAQWGLYAQTLGNIALFCFQHEWWDDCIRYAQEAQEVYASVGQEREQALMQLLAASGSAGKGHWAAAAAFCRMARPVLEKFNDKKGLQDLHTIETVIQRAGRPNGR